ncbi:hypothetical protein [Streptomyces sp. SAI-127]|uniref:hypothetical protein n=1 Tax=Streptomyces sp. SAI-127 TaxID=2940543 RepID=UPI00247387AB|nr:hypothetical protein [Streptomyces sp. SAI-127]MDH6485606.1 hypothetical protein [Streptomyces sp. SAI-127]
MVAYGAEQRVRVPAVRAGRRRQAFVHLPFPPQAVQALLPRELVATVPGLPSFAVHRRGLPPAAGAPACAAVDVLEETLTAAASLPAPLDEPVVHHSPGVEHVRPAPSRPLFT